MAIARLLLSLGFSVLLAISSAPQQPPQRDPAALTLAKLSVQAILGNQSLTDATLQGTANYSAGSDQESGAFTLEVKGNQESKLVLNLSGGTRQEIRQVQAGAWVGLDGQKRAMALHNCLIDASSLLPVFTLQAALANPNIAAVYFGQATVNGVTADHLQFSQVVAGQGQKMTTEIRALRHPCGRVLQCRVGTCSSSQRRDRARRLPASSPHGWNFPDSPAASPPGPTSPAAT